MGRCDGVEVISNQPKIITPVRAIGLCCVAGIGITQPHGLIIAAPPFANKGHYYIGLWRVTPFSTMRNRENGVFVC